MNSLSAQTDATQKSIDATFVEFSFGDTESYLFEGEDGNLWDFSSCTVPGCDFAVLLSPEEANETNQGWGSNANLVGRAFRLTYEERQQPAYIDGPMTTALVIVDVYQYGSGHEGDEMEDQILEGVVRTAEVIEGTDFWMIGVEAYEGEMVSVEMKPGGLNSISKMEELLGNEVIIEYEQLETHIVYDMVLSSDNNIPDLHEIADPGEPYVTKYSVIGRYVAAMRDNDGVFLEIEDREGTIHLLSTMIINDEWADQEVECAVYVAITTFAVGIEVK